MRDSMPGLDTALDLFDAGQPPIAPLPPPPPPPPQPQPSIRCVDTPPSSAPARVPSSLQAKVPESCPLKHVNTSSSEYRFDFGVHAGKTLDEVPPDYILFLKQRGIVEGRPALAVAVIRHEREKPSASVSSKPSPAQYTLKFGKHIGKTLSEIPEQHITWLKTTEMLDDNEDLKKAVIHYDKTHPPPKPKSKPKRSRMPNLVTPSGKIIGWDGRCLDRNPYSGRSRYSRW